MANIQIYGNTQDARIHFDNSVVRSKPLNSVEAVAHPEQTDRVIIRSIVPRKNGRYPVFFRRLNINRLENKDGVELVSTLGMDRTQVLEYLNAEFGKTLAEIAGEYKGIWNATANTPDITIPSHNPGDWYFITVAGTYGGVSYAINDQIRYNGTSFDKIEDTGVKVADIENAALSEYDQYVDPDYVGTSTGSTLKPWTTVLEAVNNSDDNSSIFIKGINIIAGEITLPHGLSFYGAQHSEIKFASYDASNGDIFSYDGDYTKKFEFFNIKFSNAGGYGLYIKKGLSMTIEDCEFVNNGWNGTGLSTTLAEAGGVLGYNSSNTDLQAFYAGSNASNGGAMRIEGFPVLRVIGNSVSNNLRGIRVSDCGIGGAGFVTRNVSNNNIESGIYLSVGSLGGCQNVTVTMNYSANNANNGLLVIGGLNNKFSQNEVNGNWNAGFCAWGAGNTTLRDCGLYDNNRSTYNGIGNTGDAKASIQINDAYNLLGTNITYNPAFRFIAEILDTQVHYTGLGSNTEKIGFLITSAVGQLADNAKNIIKVDDVGFIGQDYAIDLSEVDVTNLRLSLGDNSYQSIGQKAVKAPLQGNYSELPFSNHVMEVPEVDVVVDTLKQTISLHEGVGGNVINVYKVNELQSVLKTSTVDIVQKSSDKIQLRDLTLGNVYINGVVAGSNINTLNDSLNAAFNMSLVQYKDFLETTVGIEAGTPSTATFYYIESPDGVFYYPLFKTEAEAKAIDVIEGGAGDGSFHTHTFADDATGTTWYMNTTNSTHVATSAPTNGVYGNSTNVIWNVQATEDDASYVPTFTNITYSVQEQSAINVIYKAAGDTDTYSVTGLPTGYADNGNAIIGTAEDITNGAGQSVTHTIYVTKANDFGSVSGTITINVLANLAGNEFTIIDKEDGTIKFTQDGGLTELDFNTVTFNAGSTYKFFLDGDTLEAGDGLEIVDSNGDVVLGNDGNTQSGNAGDTGAYRQYVIPTDVAPGKFLRFYDNDTSANYSDVALTLAGSTYSAGVTGITNEGPATANGSIVTAENWYSLDETLSAGERLQLPGTFWEDVFNALQPGASLTLGIKDGAWVNTLDGNSSSGAYTQGVEYDLCIRLYKASGSNGQLVVRQNGNTQGSTLTFQSYTAQYLAAFIEITYSGNNIRMGITSNTNIDNLTTTEYANWSTNKQETGDQGYGYTSIDVMAFYDTIIANKPFDSANVDWTLLGEVAAPGAAATSRTSWTKGMDFDGSNDYMKMAFDSNTSVTPWRKTSTGAIANNSDSSKTAANSRPSIHTVMFYSESQSGGGDKYIWNSGTVQNGGMNMYLSINNSKQLKFGFGEMNNQGLTNELQINNNMQYNRWYTVTIIHKGGRFSAANATAANLADAFDIRMTDDYSASVFGTWYGATNMSRVAYWYQTGYNTLGNLGGQLTVGGRNGSGNFNGKVAALAAMTLNANATLPSQAEVELLIKDPVQYIYDYRAGTGVNVRTQGGSAINADQYYQNAGGGYQTQLWMFGDGATNASDECKSNGACGWGHPDSFVTGIHNYMHSSTSVTDLKFFNMTASDIENISISGLS